MLLRRLDRYVLSAFVAPFVVLSFLIVALFIIIDLFGRFDEFLKIEESSIVSSIFSYYLHVLPGILTQWLLPIITVISGLFAVSSLDRHHEITAMLSSGISRQRLLLPLLAVTALISLGDYILKSQLVPLASDRLESIRAQMKGEDDSEKTVRDVAFTYQDESGYTFWFAKTVHRDEQRVARLFLTRMDLEGNWLYRLRAADARREGAVWVLRDVTMQQTGLQELPQHHEQMELKSELSVEDLLLNRKAPEFLSDAQLKRLNAPGATRVELLSRPLTALTSFLLFLWSMIILFNSRQGSFLLAMGHCVLMVMGYYAFSWVIIQIATHSALPPLAVLYLPIALLLALGAYLYRRMPS